jgi:hypothetical protein
MSNDKKKTRKATRDEIDRSHEFAKELVEFSLKTATHGRNKDVALAGYLRAAVVSARVYGIGHDEFLDLIHDTWHSYDDRFGPIDVIREALKEMGDSMTELKPPASEDEAEKPVEPKAKKPTLH